MPVYLGATPIAALELGTTDVTHVYLGATPVYAPAAGPGITVIDTATTVYNTATQSPTFTFTISPVQNDVIVLFAAAVNSLAALNAVAEWTPSITPTGTVTQTACAMAVLHHVVTAGEDAANTVTWTLTNLFQATRQGALAACVVRGVNTTTPVDAFGTGVIATVVTPHDLPAVVGADITSSNGLVLRAIARDGATAYTSVPAGHTQLASSGPTQAIWLGRRDATASAGVAIPTASITPSVADEAVAVTLVLTAA